MQVSGGSSTRRAMPDRRGTHHTGFDLPARHVIHTVGPVWEGGDQGEAELLAACYRNCIRLAREHGLNSLAFPAISCGVFGYPPEAAARIALRELAEASASGMRITACLRGEHIVASYHHAARTLQIGASE